MASPACWNCLSRPVVASALPIRAIGASTVGSQSAAFSTTAVNNGNPNKQKKSIVVTTKGKQSLKLKKKGPQAKSSRRVDFGERKAFRKRVILTNSNALPVDGLADFSAALAEDVQSIGKVAGLDNELVAKLRLEEAFKPTQGWGLTHRPSMLVRKETVQLSKAMQDAHTSKSTYSALVDGPRRSGKSMLLLQALSIAHLNDWIVVHIPEAQELTTASTDYALIPESNPPQYYQHAYAAAWLRRVAKANSHILSKLKVQLEHKTPVPVNPTATLDRLAETAAREFDNAPAMFEAFWREITAPGRPPILYTVDGVAHFLNDTDYRDADFKPIHAQDLKLIKHFMDHFSGERKLPNGGAVLAAMGTGNTKASAELELALKNKIQAACNTPLTQPNPYKKFDQRSFDALKFCKVINVDGMSKEEARGLMEYWAASGLLRKRVDEQSVTQAWTLSGRGVVGELEDGALRLRI